MWSNLRSWLVLENEIEPTVLAGSIFVLTIYPGKASAISRGALELA
jgi:hypothetical protein